MTSYDKFLHIASRETLNTDIFVNLSQDRFPPNIYYKIFTHRPVQDLCANSPKDYTKSDAKRTMARDVHNKGNRVPKYGGWCASILVPSTPWNKCMTSLIVKC